MATLVLTAVGTMVGGPVGGAIGAAIGQYVDQTIIFKPKGREGARLGDRSVQTSSYGSAIPRLFGTMRVAGTVFWSTDLIEDRHKSGGGKGRPSTTTYSYSASFAVLISGRRIREVKRIWADGNLLRGAAGDFKTETGYRLYPGDEDQEADPLIASAEGVGRAPAARGCAYAVFEGFQLGAYGNRIPSLTFEVVADDAPVNVGALLGEISGGVVAGTHPASLGGFAASGDSVRGLIEAVADALPLSLVDDGAALRIGDDGAVGEIVASERRAAADRAPEEAHERGSALAVPGEVELSYYDPARDYQAGLQRARMPGAGRRSARIELAASLGAGEAKAIAEARLARHAVEREQWSLSTGWRRMALRPGEVVTLAGEPGRWRIAGWTLERMALALKLVRVRAAAMTPPLPAEPGRGVGAPDLVHGPTTVHLLDLPPIEDGAPDAPRLFVAAAGASPGWRRASLLMSTDDGGRWDPVGATAAPAVIGVATTILPDADPALFDRAGAVEVRLLNDMMMLEDADDAALLGGANQALLGDELIQFGHAEPLGDARWRLSRLLRGRRATEAGMAAHAAGERFILIEATTLARLTPPVAAIGGAVRIMASGVGDIAAPAEAVVAAMSGGVRPFAPIRLSAERTADGYLLSWVRRSRAGWAWNDGGDVPVGEAREAYRLTLRRGDGGVRLIETSESRWLYPAADAAADSAAGGPDVELLVVQIGDHAPSPAATLILALE